MTLEHERSPKIGTESWQSIPSDPEIEFFGGKSGAYIITFVFTAVHKRFIDNSSFDLRFPVYRS